MIGFLLGFVGAMVLLDAFDMDKGEVFGQMQWAEVIVGLVVLALGVLVATFGRDGDV